MNLNNKLTLLTFSLLFVLLACGGKDKEVQKQVNNNDQNPPAKQEEKNQNDGTPAKNGIVTDEDFVIKTVENPPLAPQYFKEIYDKADYTEIIFENLPFSLSQENKNGILMLLSYMDNKPPVNIDFNCPLFGHQLYQVEGEVVLEADIFMGANCNYYVFYKGEEKFYNAMTPKGVQFFESLINKAMGQ